MPLRLDEFADAFSGWMKEYQQKQQVSCGEKSSLVNLPAGGREADLRIVSDMVKDSDG